MNQPLKLPLEEEVENLIQKWDLKNWGKLSLKEIDKYIEQIKTDLTNLYGFFPRLHNFSITDRLNTSLHHHRKVYRVREYDENINEDLITEFSTRPVCLPKELMRANFPYYPVFYGSPHNATALIEALETKGKKFDPSKDNYFYLSEWVLKEWTPLNIIWFAFGKYNPESDLSLFSEHYIKNLQENLAINTNKEKELLDSILESTSSLFARDEINAFGACMAHIHLYHQSIPRTELFVYPSIQSDKTSLNYAIHPNTVMHKMYLRKVFQFKIYNYEKKGFGKVNYHIGRADKCGLNDYNGHLVWNEFSETDEKEFEILFPNNFQ